MCGLETAFGEIRCRPEQSPKKGIFSKKHDRSGIVKNRTSQITTTLLEVLPEVSPH
jgi:hypothetical protein